MQHFYVCVCGFECVDTEVGKDRKAKASCCAEDQGVSKTLSPDMLGALAVDQLRAVLMLMLKAEQAAIKTVSPLEWSWRDCLLLSEIPPGACSHFLSFTSLIFSRLSLSLPSLRMLTLTPPLSVGRFL